LEERLWKELDLPLFPGYLFIRIAVLSVNVIARSIAVELDLCDLEPVLVRRLVAGSPDNEKALNRARNF